MSLKNVLIIVDNIDESIDFYEELFGLRVITRLEGNVPEIISTKYMISRTDVCRRSVCNKDGTQVVL